MKVSPVRLHDALLRQDLSKFIARTFATVNPGTDYLPSWHIDAIADYLTACSRGECSRLIINMPPRQLKSLCVSVGWPAWLLGRDPTTRVIAASYSARLAEKHALDCRLVSNSEWYQRLFPWFDVRHDQNEKHKFVTSQGGFRLATSTGGTLTGEGGEFIIVDDPLNPGQAESARLRTTCNQWFDQTLMSRLDDFSTGVVVIVMQRLHEDDLTGHVLAKEGGAQWRQLVLPAYAEQSVVIEAPSGVITYSEGEVLHEQRMDMAILQQVRNALGSYAYAAQYQQQPLMMEGGMINPGWFGRFDAECVVEDEAKHMVVQSWDTAIKDGSQHDFSVCTTWRVTSEYNYQLLDVFRDRMDYPRLRKQTEILAERWQPDVMLIEDKASGQSLLQDLRSMTALPVLPVMPRGDKRVRMAACSALIEAGRVLLPKRASWLAEFEEEMVRFPHGRYDDQVDSVSQFLGWVRGRQQQTVRIRTI